MTMTMQEQMKYAVRTGDSQRIHNAVTDWLSGLFTDEELTDHLCTGKAHSSKHQKGEKSPGTGDIALAMCENEDSSAPGGDK